MTVLVFLVILCPVSFSYASIVFASAALSGLFLGSPDLFLIFPGIFWAFQVFSSHAGLFRELLHLYLALLRCRDEFLLARFIPSLLFSSTEIISTARIHPQLALFFHRDDFFRSDSSPACSFSQQGLSRPPGFRSDSSPACSFFSRDDFFRSDSFPACSFLPQG